MNCIRYSVLNFDIVFLKSPLDSPAWKYRREKCKQKKNEKKKEIVCLSHIGVFPVCWLSFAKIYQLRRVSIIQTSSVKACQFVFDISLILCRLSNVNLSQYQYAMPNTVHKMLRVATQTTYALLCVWIFVYKCIHQKPNQDFVIGLRSINNNYEIIAAEFFFLWTVLAGPQWMTLEVKRIFRYLSCVRNTFIFFLDAANNIADRIYLSIRNSVWTFRFTATWWCAAALFRLK